MTSPTVFCNASNIVMVEQTANSI